MFSPDGKWIAFIVGRRQLVKVPVDGGTPVALAPVPDYGGLEWATGGDIVGFDSDYPPFVVDSDGTDAISVIVPEALDPDGAYHVNFHLAPDNLGVLIGCGDLFRI